MRTIIPIVSTILLLFGSGALTGNMAARDIVPTRKEIRVTTPGSLYRICKMTFDGVDTNAEFGEEVWTGIKTLKISGDIDARDFSTIKWNLRGVETVDLSEATIAGYEGEYGTNEGYFDGGEYSRYPKNTIPIGAFFYWMGNQIREFPMEFYDEGVHSTKRIILPVGITRIGRNAFARNYNLKEINIPEGVTAIEMVAFRYCTSIEVLYLPESLSSIGYLAFTDMYSLREVHIKAHTAPTTDNSFGDYPDGDTRGGVLLDNPDYMTSTGARLYVPKGCRKNYEAWERYFQVIIEE